ncbi:MAG: methylenetetrahydrofolate reductase [Actinomycetaceae bacterium]|nr:methylenetetrahydrofolate reductase [Arcanobacterium sp.]MDD7505702.1 methylenetetrahydrofolate reductase [Actinomycetaceae bacterium]MDY6143690.1 methylenetetrahydrofolate reductase [Arcanobacterium sp.]
MSLAESSFSQLRRDHLAPNRTTKLVSFEVMPPRHEKAVAPFLRNLDALLETCPDFVSVTYGAGGKDRANARNLVTTLVSHSATHPIAHMTTVGATRTEISSVITDYLEEGVRTFLALRGDPPADDPQWRPGPDGVHTAAELTGLIRSIEARRCTRHPGLALRQAIQPLTIAVATFVEGNPAYGTTADQEIENLLLKQEAGASFAITQVFWDADLYTHFVAKARREGVTLPIVPGVLPPTDPKRLERVGELTGVYAPGQMIDRITHADDPYAEGIAVGARLVRELIERDAPGVHVYTFNKSQPALDLLRASGLIGAEPATPYADDDGTHAGDSNTTYAPTTAA